jgi:hypothetical protein
VLTQLTILLLPRTNTVTARELAHSSITMRFALSETWSETTVWFTEEVLQRFAPVSPCLKKTRLDLGKGVDRGQTRVLRQSKGHGVERVGERSHGVLLTPDWVSTVSDEERTT